MANSKLRSASEAGDDGCALDMSPMIDMVFLLLMFFLVNASAIIVKQDKMVSPPVASNSKVAKERNGRIVVNVYNDGTFTDEGGKTLENEDAIVELVKAEKDKINAIGWTPRLHLRGDKAAYFKHGRTAIRAAAKAGVDQVVFAVYLTDK